MSAPAAPPAAGTVGEALTASREALAAAGVGEPALDASLLLAAATGLDRAALIARPETPVDPAPGGASGRCCAAGSSASRSPTCSAGAASAGSSSRSTRGR